MMITLSADDFSNVFRAGNGNAFGHVHALSPGLVVIQRIFIVIQTEQRELVQGDLQGSLVIQGVPLSTAAAPLHVGEQRTRHLGWVWKQRGKTYRRRVGLSWERQVFKKAPLVRIQCALAPCVQTSDNFKKSVQSRSVEYALFPETGKPAVAIFPFRVRTPPLQLVSVRCLTRCSQTGHYQRICAHDVTPGLTGQGRCRARLRFACATLIGRIPDRDRVQPQLGAPRPFLLWSY